MKNKKHQNKAVWTCDFCEQEFGTKNEADKHELGCKNNSANRGSKWNLVMIIGSVILILIMVGFFFSSANESGNDKISPTPTIDPDPIVKCSWKNDQNPNQPNCADKMMKSSECFDSVCCNLLNGSWTPLSKIECAKFQAQVRGSKPAISVPLPQTTHCYPDLLGGVTCTTQ